MILYIAEKPSLGRAIADVLPKPHKKGNGFIELGNGDCVTWCIGHLLEQAEPDAYDPAFKRWQFEHLPIVPDHWQLIPKTSTKGQLTVVKRLIRKASQLVHAGDPDREGQLLVDELLSHAGVSSIKLGAVQRLLVSDLNPNAVRRALGHLRPNKEFVPLATSALARSRADWLYGMNLTRAYTIQGKKVGYTGVLSVGRVQTPLLGLVVRRDLEIEAFKTKQYFEVFAELDQRDGFSFDAKWQPSEACQPYLDEEGRVLSRRLAETVVMRISGKQAEVVDVSVKDKRQTPPLPYSLSALQIDCGKRFGMSAKKVLDIAQQLYERHKLITYPRSDSRHLPREQHSLAAGVVAAIQTNAPELLMVQPSPDTTRLSKAWDDSKVDAHHAIVPTEKRANLEALSNDERQLYLQIARQYLAQFYPDRRYSDTEAKLVIEGGRFIAKGRQEREAGWRVLFGNAELEAVDKMHEQYPVSPLPKLVKGQRLHCMRGRLAERETQPPKHFTDASLLAAMTGIARFVTSPDIRKILRETDGLGTEATRAGIIELLFRRGFLARKGKSIVASAAGRGLIASLPLEATTADMTALWERRLNDICQRRLSYQGFIESLVLQLRSMVKDAADSPLALAGVPSNCNEMNRRKRPSGTAAAPNKRKSRYRAKRGVTAAKPTIGTLKDT